MESSQERRVLRELERHLQRQDPAFVSRMRGTPVPRPFPALLALAAGLYILIPVVMLLFGWGGVVVLLGVATLFVVFRRGRRSRAKVRRSGPPEH